jgi:hypothetical protein
VCVCVCVCVCAAVNAAKWNRKPEGSSEERKIYGVATRTQQVSDLQNSVGRQLGLGECIAHSCKVEVFF